MSRGQRTKLAPGVWEDRYGRTIIVTVDGDNIEERYPPKTPIPLLVRARATLAAKYADPAARPGRHRRDRAGQVVAPVDAGPTVQAGVDAYLATLPTGSTHRTNAAQLAAHWLTALGASTPLATVTGAQLLAVVADWKTIQQATRRGHAASTLNKRRDTLRGIYRVVFGVGGINPTAELGQRQPEPAFGARAIPRTAVDYIFAAMPDSRTKTRLRVLAETGFPPAMIQRLEPRHVDYRAGTCYVHGRYKAKKAIPPRTVPVTAAALDALRDLFAQGAQRGTGKDGRISVSSMWKSFRLAVQTARDAYEAGEGLTWPAPDNVRPYDLRHSFLTDLYAACGNEPAVRDMAIHAPDSPITARYIRGAVAAASVASRDALQKKTESTTVPFRRPTGARLGTPLGPSQNIRENA